MPEWKEKLIFIQKAIQKNGWDGWLLYDFRKSNDLACHFLGIAKESLVTRRFFYWIPKVGDPIKIVHRIESHVLAHVPGNSFLYSSYEELENHLRSVLVNAKKIAMEYSYRNAIPTLSKVDAGTIDIIRDFGVEVESSGDLLQNYTCIWSPEQFQSHCEAAIVLQHTVEKAWNLIVDSINKGKTINEFQVQCFILQEFENNGCMTEAPPICAVNAHSANPHYSPIENSSSVIKRGDFVLIDVWCKKRSPHAVYADITRVAVVDNSPTKMQQEVFCVVKAGRDAALDLLRQRVLSGYSIRGWEVDQVCRETISKTGYGEYFTHRTGHNIGERDHGDGANIDNFETKDFRQLLPGTCFSIEPGIYLPGKFGIRLEDDVYLSLDGKGLHVTPGLQEEILCLF